MEKNAFQLEIYHILTFTVPFNGSRLMESCFCCLLAFHWCPLHSRKKRRCCESDDGQWEDRDIVLVGGMRM